MHCVHGVGLFGSCALLLLSPGFVVLTKLQIEVHAKLSGALVVPKWC